MEKREINQMTIELMKTLQKIIQEIQQQTYVKAMTTLASLDIGKLGAVLEFYIKRKDIEEELFYSYNPMEIIEEMFQIQEQKDYLKLADIYQEKLLGFLQVVYNHTITVENREKENQSSTTNFQVTPDRYGRKTLQGFSNGKTYLLHSQVNAFQSDFLWAKSVVEKEVANYIVYGIGLGHHIEALASLREIMHIRVFESNKEIYEIFQQQKGEFFSKKSTEDKKIEIVYDPQGRKLLETLQKQSGQETEKFLIHHPSIRFVEENSLKNFLIQAFESLESIQGKLERMNDNFDVLIESIPNFIEECQEDFAGKTVFIVAAGPSLDKNISKLKEYENRGDCLIFSTGSVFRKLMQKGITPDFVVISDPNPIMRRQIEGLEVAKVPLILLPTAFKGVAKAYQGPKYLALQKDFRRAREYGEIYQKQLFETGGSVSTIALDISICLNAKRIVFLGLDLAYTDGFVHASDSERREQMAGEELILTESQEGEKIQTTKALLSFKVWIEDRIKNVNDIEIINATEGGAKINGMRLCKMDSLGI